MKAFVAVGDKEKYVGLGVEVSKEVSKAIRGAVAVAKLLMVPVRRGYWGDKNKPLHTVPFEVSLLKNYKFLLLAVVHYQF